MVKKMTKYVGIASGKGGVGKTTVSINLAMALNNLGYNTILLDANLSTPHIAMHLGAPLVPITLHDVLNGKNNLTEATYQHPSGLKIVPASISLDELDELNPRKLSNLLFDQELGDLTVIDMAAGLTGDVTPIFSMLDELLVVTNADMPSVTEALKTIKLAEKNHVEVKGIILNKSTNKNLISIKNIESILGKNIISVIPEDNQIKNSLKMNHPLVYAFPDSPASIEFKKLAAVLMGKRYEENIGKGFLQNLLNKLGFF